MNDLSAIVASAVAATKDVPASVDAVEAAGDIVGTVEAEPTVDDASTDDGDGVDPAPAASMDALGNPIEKAPAAKKKDEPVPVETDDFEQVPARGADGRTNRIPHNRVRVMVDNAVRKATTAISSELTALKPRVQDYEARLTKVGQIEHVMFNDAPQMLSILRTIPGYEQLLGTAAAPAAATPAVSEQPPAPDYTAPDGSKGYTPEGLQKLLDWNADRATARATAAAEERLGKRFQPIERREQALAQQQALTTKVSTTLTEAAKMPHFAENQGEILKVLAADSEQAKTSGRYQLNLMSAYHQVVFGRLTTDRQKVREELIQELKKAPVSTSAGSAATRPATGVEAAPLNARASLEQTIKNSLKAAR